MSRWRHPVEEVVDLSPRILAGRPGTGKTLYLRRLQAYAAQDGSVYAAPVAVDVPPTDAVVRVTQRGEPAMIGETWMRIWQRATIRAAVSHLRRSRHLRLDPSAEEALADHGLIPATRTPRSVYAEVNAILGAHAATADSLRRYLEHYGWADIEYELGQALRSAPPLMLFLDGIDEQFSRAPAYWLRCQEGLVLAILSTLRNPVLSRLRVVACVRDLAIASVARSEHATRFRGDPRVRVLEWDHDEILAFLLAKIERLDDSDRMRPSLGGVAGWLGISSVTVRDGFTESVEEYLLRHTRMTPADIIVLGNAVCLEVSEAQRAGQSSVSQEAIVRSVAEVSRQFAAVQLQRCGNQLASEQMPADAAIYGYTDFFVGGEFSEVLASSVREALGNVGHERFGAEELDRLDASGRAVVEGVSLADVLWQNQLLGVEQPSATRFRLFLSDPWNIPRASKQFVFHPCLSHAFALQPVGEPVGGFGRRVT